MDNNHPERSQPLPSPASMQSSANRGSTSADRTLYLQSVDLRVPEMAFFRPEVAFVVTEDFCWRVAVADWDSRRPPWWRRRSKDAWRAERDVLRAKRERIRALAEEFDITTAAAR